MAKKTEKGGAAGAPATTNQGLTAENVMDHVHKGNLISQALSKRVVDKIKEEGEERKANDLKERVLKASYRRIRSLINLRTRRRESEITLEHLKNSELLEDSLSGFVLTEDKIKKHGGKDGKLTFGDKEYELKDGEEVWVDGILTCNEYDEKARDLSNDRRKKMSESDKIHSKDMQELRDQYPSWWRYDWDD